MRPLNVRSSIDALSAPRLSNYHLYFNVADDHDLYACYQWNNELSRAFLPCVHLLEVTIRNIYHRELSLYYSHLKSGRAQATFNWYSHMKLSGKSLSAINDAIRKRKNPDHVISKQTFGFWTNLPDEPTTPWNQILQNVFPNINRNWGKTQNIDWLYARMKLINDFRNRIAHWEPVWKLGPLLQETRPRQGSQLASLKPPTATPQESVDRLKMIHDRATSLLKGLDSDVYDTYLDSYSCEHLKWVCSIEALNTFRNYERRTEMRLHDAKRKLKQLIQSKSIITITHRGASARLVPLQ